MHKRKSRASSVGTSNLPFSPITRIEIRVKDMRNF